jgi:signal transduction histidine kinase
LKWDLEAVDKTLWTADNQFQLPAVREKIGAMMKVTDSTINTVRRIASELRPSILDDLGLLEAVEWQAQNFQARTGIVCHCECSLEEVGLNRDQSTVVFRIFQEALTNILRHAQATRVEVVMENTVGEFVLTIKDNGRGITEEEKTTHLSLGILGIQERAHLVNGRVDVVGSPGRGTLVAVRIPLSGAPQDSNCNYNHEKNSHS